MMDRLEAAQYEHYEGDSVDRIVADSGLDGSETHATTGGAAAAGAVTGGVIGLAGGPLGAAIGAVGGAIVGVASERLMHSDDDRERARNGAAQPDRDPELITQH